MWAESSRRSIDGRAGEVRVTTTVDCRLMIDGKTIGWLGADRTVDFALARGDYTLQAASRGGSVFFSERIEVRKGRTISIAVKTPGRVIVHPRNRTVEDLESGLMWQMTDNGSDISRSGAEAYCEELGQGGYSDWRLPSIFELERIYAPEAAETRRFRTIAGITLTGCCPWTSTPHGDFHWTLLFYNGLRYIKHESIGKFSRALCVRDAWRGPAPSG